MIAATKESELVQRGDTSRGKVLKHSSPDHTLGEGVASPIASEISVTFSYISFTVTSPCCTVDCEDLAYRCLKRKHR